MRNRNSFEPGLVNRRVTADQQVTVYFSYHWCIPSLLNVSIGVAWLANWTSGVKVFHIDSDMATARSSVLRTGSGRIASWSESVAAAEAKKG